MGNDTLSLKFTICNKSTPFFSQSKSYLTKTLPLTMRTSPKMGWLDNKMLNMRLATQTQLKNAAARHRKTCGWSNPPNKHPREVEVGFISAYSSKNIANSNLSDLQLDTWGLPILHQFPCCRSLSIARLSLRLDRLRHVHVVWPCPDAVLGLLRRDKGGERYRCWSKARRWRCRALIIVQFSAQRRDRLSFDALVVWYYRRFRADPLADIVLAHFHWIWFGEVPKNAEWILAVLGGQEVRRAGVGLVVLLHQPVLPRPRRHPPLQPAPVAIALVEMLVLKQHSRLVQPTIRSRLRLLLSKDKKDYTFSPKLQLK